MKVSQISKCTPEVGVAPTHWCAIMLRTFEYRCAKDRSNSSFVLHRLVVESASILLFSKSVQFRLIHSGGEWTSTGERSGRPWLVFSFFFALNFWALSLKFVRHKLTNSLRLKLCCNGLLSFWETCDRFSCHIVEKKINLAMKTLLGWQENCCVCILIQRSGTCVLWSLAFRQHLWRVSFWLARRSTIVGKSCFCAFYLRALVLCPK